MSEEKHARKSRRRRPALDIYTTEAELRHALEDDGGSGFACVLEDISRMGYRFYKGQRRLEPYLEGTELGRPYLLAR